VAHVLPDHFQGDALFKLPGSAGVPQGMAGGPPGDGGRPVEVLDVPLHRPGRAAEQMIVGLDLPVGGIGPDQRDRPDVQGRPSVLAPLPLADEDRAPFRRDAPDEELLELADAQACEEHDPDGDEVLEVLDRQQESVYLIVGGDLREDLLPCRLCRRGLDIVVLEGLFWGVSIGFCQRITKSTTCKDNQELR
jgi:hypothetical protein